MTSNLLPPPASTRGALVPGKLVEITSGPNAGIVVRITESLPGVIGVICIHSDMGEGRPFAISANEVEDLNPFEDVSITVGTSFVFGRRRVTVVYVLERRHATLIRRTYRRERAEGATKAEASLTTMVLADDLEM